MKFDDLRDGVISFSNFVIGHCIWFGLTIFSINVAFGEDFSGWLLALPVQFDVFYRAQLQPLVTTYSLAALVPAFVAFLAVFVLHAHVRIAESIGRHIPPTFVTNDSWVFRYLTVSDWLSYRYQLKKTVTLSRLREIAYSEHALLLEQDRKEGYIAYLARAFGTPFRMFKFYAMLNLALAGLAIPLNLPQGLISLVLALGFGLLAVCTEALHLFQKRQACFQWVHSAFNAALAKPDIGEAMPSPREPDEDIADRKLIRSFKEDESRFGFVIPDWDIPLVGSLMTLRERLRERRL